MIYRSRTTPPIWTSFVQYLFTTYIVIFYCIHKVQRNDQIAKLHSRAYVPSKPPCVGFSQRPQTSKRRARTTSRSICGEPLSRVGPIKSIILLYMKSNPADLLRCLESCRNAPNAEETAGKKGSATMNWHRGGGPPITPV